MGDTYDSAGNLILAQPGNVQYTYDAENHLISTAGQTYLYDGDGKRVEKATNGTPLVPNKLYWYGTDSSPVIETDTASTPSATSAGSTASMAAGMSLTITPSAASVSSSKPPTTAANSPAKNGILSLD